MYSGAAVAEIAAGNLAYATTVYGFSWCDTVFGKALHALQCPQASSLHSCRTALFRSAKLPFFSWQGVLSSMSGMKGTDCRVC